MDFECFGSDYTVICSTSTKARRCKLVGAVGKSKVAGCSRSPGVRQVLRTRVVSSAMRVRRLCAGAPSSLMRVSIRCCAINEVGIGMPKASRFRHCAARTEHQGVGTGAVRRTWPLPGGMEETVAEDEIRARFAIRLLQKKHPRFFTCI
jgi:hypothetical protein